MVFLGTTLNLSCPFDNFVTAEWFHNGVPLNKSTLLLNPVSLEDKGDYSCRVRNLADENEYNFTLNVHISPQSMQNTTNKYSHDLIIGDNVTLECALIGYPIPNITWYLNDVLLPINEELFTITNLKLSDAGNYFCVATNEHGSARENFHLNVKGN